MKKIKYSMVFIIIVNDVLNKIKKLIMDYGVVMSFN